MVRKLLSFFIPLCLLVFAGCQPHGNEAGATDVAEGDTLQLILMRAQQCSRLYTTEFHVHKIVTYNDLLSVRGKLFNHDYSFALPLGERKIAFPMDATLKGYIDLSQLTETDFIRDGEKLTIVLPAPKVMMTATKIKQEDVKEFVSLTRAHFSDQELSALEQQGREAIIRNMPSYGIEEQARKSAARLLLPIILQMGFREQDVTIVFPDDFSPAALQRLVELKTETP